MKNINSIFKNAFLLLDKNSLHDPTHQKDHIERVLALIRYLAEKENPAQNIDWESLKLAAVFHDLGSIHRIKKLRSNSDKSDIREHSSHSSKMAEIFLKEEDFPAEQIKKIQEIISLHDNGGDGSNLEGNLLHDADKLDGIGLVGMIRIFTFGGQINRNPTDTLEFIKQKMKNLKFKTKAGQKLGRERIKQAKKWIGEIGRELVKNTDT